MSETHRTSNSVALLSKRMRSLADLASHKEPAISEALIDGVVQIERLTRVAAEVEMMALTLEARDKEIERLTRELRLAESARDYANDMLDKARSGYETAAPQAPIAKVIVREDGPADVMLYAPGLPPGEHDLYCEPEAVAPMMRDETAAVQTCPTCGADWYWPTSPSKATGESSMTDEQIKHMVNRFLGWKLPANFSPDAGISFKPEYNVECNAARDKPPARHEPSGTNLFDAVQAEAMVRYMVEGMPGSAQNGSEPREGER